MTTFTLLAWIAVILLLPIVFLFWLTESRQQRASRWRRDGMTQQAIADRFGVSRSTIRRWTAA